MILIIFVYDPKHWKGFFSLRYYSWYYALKNLLFEKEWKFFFLNENAYLKTWAPLLIENIKISFRISL